MKRPAAFAATLSVAAALLFVLAPPVHAGWQNDGTTYDPNDSVVHTEGGVSNTRTGTSIVSFAAAEGTPVPEYENYQVAAFVTSFSWTGGGTPTTYFTVPGNGTLTGTRSGGIGGDAWREAYGSAFGPGYNSTWADLDPPVYPSGNIGVNASGSSTSLTWYISTSALGQSFYGTYWGSYDVYAKADYSVGDPN